MPNTELGHLQIRGKDAEHRAAESVREAEQLSWKKWARRLNEYFAQLEALLWPDLIVVGGGVSKKSDKFLPHLMTRAEVVPAQLLNEAGIVGAAVVTEHPAWANDRLTLIALGRAVRDRGAAGEPVLGPVPPVDRLLAFEPAQQIGRGPTVTWPGSR